MNKKNIIVGITVLLISVGLSGCQEESEESKFVGTWYTSADIDPSELNFFSNGTYTSFSQDHNISSTTGRGAFEIDMGKLVLTPDNSNTTITFDYGFTDDNAGLVLEILDTGFSAVYTKQ